MDAIKKNENNLISLENGNDNWSSVISEEFPSHEREETQRPCNVVIDDPILISDSDDSSNHSNQSWIHDNENESGSSDMDAIKKNENNLISLENRNDNGSSVISEEEVTSHEREVSQRPCNVVIDDPILISDSDDSSNHSNESNIQCISDDEEPPNTHAGESTSQIQLPKISSYGSIGKGYMRDFFIRNGYPVFSNESTSDEDDED